MCYKNADKFKVALQKIEARVRAAVIANVRQLATQGPGTPAPRDAPRDAPLKVLISTDSILLFDKNGTTSRVYHEQIKEYLYRSSGYVVTLDVAMGRSFSKGWNLPVTSPYDVSIMVSAKNHLMKGCQIISEQGWNDHKRDATFNEISKIGQALKQSRFWRRLHLCRRSQ